MPGLAVAVGLTALTIAGCTSPVMTGSSQLTHRQLLTGASCLARPRWAAIKLTDTTPSPAITLRVGQPLVVTVPSRGWRRSTDVRTFGNRILRAECTVPLPGGGRRAIFLATKPGRTWLGATVEPAGNLEMPAWSGHVTVRA